MWYLPVNIAAQAHADGAQAKIPISISICWETLDWFSERDMEMSIEGREEMLDVSDLSNIMKIRASHWKRWIHLLALIFRKSVSFEYECHKHNSNKSNNINTNSE